MEEFDSHTEHAQEQAHEAAHESKEKWITGVALTAALLAALAAMTSMLAGHHEHEAMIQQIQASDKWTWFQATGIKLDVRKGRIEAFEMAGKPVPEKLKEDAAKSESTKNKLNDEATELQKSSKQHDHLHVSFGRAVTCFQVAIAVAAISALTRRRLYWFVGIAIGGVAIYFLVTGLIDSRKLHESEESEAATPPAAVHSESHAPA